MDMIKRPTQTTPLRSLQDEVNRLFDSVFPRTMRNDGEPTSSVWSPRMDLIESDESYHLQVDLPGVSKKDVSITVDDGRLSIRGERREEARTEDQNAVRMERAFGTFYRSMRLPKAVNEQQIHARFDNGVLFVEIPKTEKSKPKQIKIS